MDCTQTYGAQVIQFSTLIMTDAYGDYTTGQLNTATYLITWWGQPLRMTGILCYFSTQPTKTSKTNAQIYSAAGWTIIECRRGCWGVLFAFIPLCLTKNNAILETFSGKRKWGNGYTKHHMPSDQDIPSNYVLGWIYTSVVSPSDDMRY